MLLQHVLNRSVTALLSVLLSHHIIIIWLFHTGRALASVPLSSCGAYIHTTHVVAMVPRESKISVDGKAEHSCHYHRYLTYSQNNGSPQNNNFINHHAVPNPYYSLSEVEHKR